MSGYKSPKETDAEQSVLVSILLDREHREKAFNSLNPDDFYSTANRIVFEKCIELQNNGGNIEVADIYSALSKDERKFVKADFLYSLVDSIPMAVNIESYITKLKDAAKYRRAIDLCNAVAKSAEKSDSEAMGRLTQQLAVETKDAEARTSRNYRCTDIGNGERFADQHQDEVRYCRLQKKWLVWNGKRWQPDEEGLVNQRAKQTARSIYSEVAGVNDSARRKELAKWAASSEAAYRQRAMIEMAKSESGIPVLPDELDRDEWLLNVNNGTLSLKTGEVLPHRKEDLITKFIPINYDPDAYCPKWIDFLSQVIKGNQQLIDYLWRVAGYTLTGDAGEQCLFLLWGVGQNGKSTFLNVLQTILNDYALQTDFNTFNIKKGEGIRNDIARMAKSRLVVAIETSDGKRMDETVVKQLTGGDRVTARRLYQEYFEFRPEFKIFLATNYKPEIHGQDLAIWRRIRLIPFTVTIPEENRINNYESVLLEEKEGILNWMVSGCREWLEKGLDEPEEVKAATKAYRSEMDILEDFIAVRCFIADGERTAHKELYSAYEDWCDESGETPIRTRTFAKKLQGRGFVFTKPKNLKTWHDIGLK
jgi:putative DNA primase/helicase